MKHRVSDINEVERTGMCSVCGPTKLKMRDKSKPVSGRYRCNTIYKCDFKPVHISQLDVDHIDGDRFNNDPVNLQTLCANCHRLKTHLAGDSNSGIN